jgi:hypothetical protein
MGKLEALLNLIYNESLSLTHLFFNSTKQGDDEGVEDPKV